MQLLYQWEIGWAGSNGSGEAARAYWACHPAPPARRGFATALVDGTTTHLDTIDALLASNARNWRLARMPVVDRLIMRLAIYELVYTDTPTAVVIDEALELARTFSAGEAVAFVNGVLDGVSRQIRTGPAGRVTTP